MWRGLVVVSMLGACELAYPAEDLSNGAPDPTGAGGAADAGAGGAPCVTAADCDDGNTCTIDACQGSGCTHDAETGAKCNDGNACNAAGTCTASGQCAASPVAPAGLCGGNSCPGGFFVSELRCDPFCGECPLCLNAITCTFACTPTVTVCCGNDCSTACPAGYHVTSASMKLAVCGCGDVAPGDAVTCSL